jgi:predicted patatin/cPLA2 family phospholipase
MQFDQLVLAGGGNRCWWQAGFWNALNEAVPQHPTKIVAVSAGAATACLFSSRPGDEGARWGLNYYAKLWPLFQTTLTGKTFFQRSPFFRTTAYTERP